MELILTPSIRLDTIVRIILFPRRGSHYCSPRGSVAAERTSCMHGTKNVEISTTFIDPYQQRLRKRWNFFFFLFSVFQRPFIRKLLEFRYQGRI